MREKLIYILFPLSFLASQMGWGQVLINEVVTANSLYLDADGDTPDWIELYNSGTGDVNLNGWTLTDDPLNPGKWAFPEVTIGAGEYLILWASGKNRLSTGFPRTLVNFGASYKYLVPTQAVDMTWMNPGFDDSSWTTGNSSFGYGDGDDTTIIPQGSLSVLARTQFNIADLTTVEEIILDMDYDDAFVAYLNGAEIARSNVYGNPPDWNTTANAGREAYLYQGGTVERYVLSNASSLLQEGTNTFAVSAHNLSGSSSDLSLIPFLSVLYNTNSSEGVPPPALLQLSARYLHTSFRLSSEGEELYLFDAVGNQVDGITIPSLPGDISYGRSGINWLLFQDPTPGSPNGGSTFIGRVENQVTFSHPGGITKINSVELGGATGEEVIRYTLNGTEPNESSTLYSGPINILSTTVIRAAIFRSGYYPSEIESRSYIKNTATTLPVVSLVTDPANFFDPVTGIYVLGEGYSGNFPYFGSNIWEDWERPIHVSFYEPGGALGTEFNAGVKIFGGWSRAQVQKSLSFFARGQYGDSEINYPLFPDYPYSSFQGIVLRNSGNDFLNTNIRDGILTSLMKSADLEIQAFRPIVAYLNGQYWGIYNMREKVNEHFIANKQNVDPDMIDLLETNANIIQGSNQEYLDLIQFMYQNPVNLEQNYAVVASQIDIDNFITYQLAQIFFDNTDWPGNNNKFWKSPGGKWRWILFDTDFGFGAWNPENYNNNTLAFALQDNGPFWPNPPWSTYLLRALVTNRTFRDRFINLFADNLNTRFLPSKVLNHIDSISAIVQPEISRHYSNWGSEYQVWVNNINNMKYFGERRAEAVKTHIRNEFNLSSIHRIYLALDNPDQGYIKLNSLDIRTENWSGDYFRGVPVELTAIPNPGYTFTHWSGDFNSTDPSIQVNLTSDANLTAHFTEGTLEGVPLVINEINYNSSPERDGKDWVEIYNPNGSAMDVSGYELRDDDDTHQFFFPQGTFIEAQGYLVICRSLADFEFQYPSVDVAIGNMDFGLSSNGDAVRLFDAQGVLQDEVYYRGSIPWPIEANGLGWTLELVNPFLDNLDPSNWASLNTHGSPGRANSIVSSVNETLDGFTMKAFPNPFRNQVNVSIYSPAPAEASIYLYSLNGQKLKSIYSGSIAPGTTTIQSELSDLNPGIYLLRYWDSYGQNKTLKILRSK